MWQQIFKEEIEKTAKSKEIWKALGLSLAPGFVAATTTHPVEHALYGDPDKPISIAGKTLVSKEGKPVTFRDIKKPWYGHLAVRLPKSLLASLASFGTYHVLSKRLGK